MASHRSIGLYNEEGQRQGPKPVADLSFLRFAELLEGIACYGTDRVKKIGRLKRYIDLHVKGRRGDDLFHLFRLLLPKLDNERGYYGIKEKRLCSLLVAALGASAHRAAAAKDWPRLAHRMQAKFPTIMQKVLLDHYCPASVPPEAGCLTLAMVNAALDRLAAIAGNAATATTIAPAGADPGVFDEERSRLRALTGGQATTAQQVEVLRGLLRLCTPLAGRWLLSIILKQDLPIGLGEKALLCAFHPDAFAAFSACSDLRRVLCGLSQPGSTWRRKDVEPGIVVSPQLAARCDGGVEGAVRRMRGRPFLVETKFDGWRIQLHVTGTGVGPRNPDTNASSGGGGGGGGSGNGAAPPGPFHYFSRNLKDHGKRSEFSVLDAAVAHFLAAAAAAAALDLEAGALGIAPGAVAAGKAAAAAAASAVGGGGARVDGLGSGGDGEVEVQESGGGGSIQRQRRCDAVPRVVLDGEMLVWNKRRCCFEPFGLLESTIKAAAAGCEPDTVIKGRDVAATDATDAGYQHPRAAELEVVYVVFDVLYLGDTSVVHLPLKERQDLLAGLLPPGGGPVHGAAPGGAGGGAGGSLAYGGDAVTGGGGHGVPLGPRGAITFRAEALLPGRPMRDGRVHSRVCSSAQEVQQLLDSATEAGEEGIVVKALDEPYRLGCRSETWIKIKPDYLTLGEFDAVIIGQLYDHTKSQTSVGGVYLLGLPETAPQPGKPTTYVTFATVGVGVSREQRQLIIEPRLKDNLVPSRPRPGSAAPAPATTATTALLRRPKRSLTSPHDAADAGAELGAEIQAPAAQEMAQEAAGGREAAAAGGSGRSARLRGVPAWCRATGSKDEWPDWWVVDPDRSVVVQVNADVRLTRTSTFAAGHTLRFPRVTRIRTDKSPAQATTLQDLAAMVAGMAGRGGGGRGGGGAAAAAGGKGSLDDSLAEGRARPAELGRGHYQRARTAARLPPLSRVPQHLLASDVSEVPVHFDLLRGAFVALEGLYGARVVERRRELGRLVRLLGGRCSANYVACGSFRTSFVVVDEWVESCHGRDGRDIDLLRPAWLEECYCQRRLVLPPRPSLAWRLSSKTLAAHVDCVDRYGDPYYEFLDVEDLAALLQRHVVPTVEPARAGDRRPRIEAAATSPRIRAGAGPRNRETTPPQPLAATHSRTAGVAPARLPAAARLPEVTAATSADVLRWLDAEMLEEGEQPPAGPHRLFAGDVVLLLDLTPPPPSPSIPRPALRAAGRTADEAAAQRWVGSRHGSEGPRAVAAVAFPDALVPPARDIPCTTAGKVLPHRSPGHAATARKGLPPAAAGQQGLPPAATGQQDLPPAAAAGQQGLLAGVSAAAAAARRWAGEEAPRHQLEDLRLGVLRGGGRVVDRWSRDVTHVVLYDGVVDEDGAEEGELAACCESAGTAATWGAAAGALDEPGVTHGGGRSGWHGALGPMGSAAGAGMAHEHVQAQRGRMEQPRPLAAEVVLAALRAVCTAMEWAEAVAEADGAANAAAVGPAGSASDRCCYQDWSGSGCHQLRAWRSSLALLIHRLTYSGCVTDNDDKMDNNDHDTDKDHGSAVAGPVSGMWVPLPACRDGGISGVWQDEEKGEEQGEDGTAAGALRGDERRLRGSPVQLVDWRWIRDSLRQARRGTEAAAGAAGKSVAGDACPGSLVPLGAPVASLTEHPDDDNNDHEEEVAVEDEEEDSEDDWCLAGRLDRGDASMTCAFTALPEALHPPHVKPVMRGSGQQADASAPPGALRAAGAAGAAPIAHPSDGPAEDGIPSAAPRPTLTPLSLLPPPRRRQQEEPQHEEPHLQRPWEGFDDALGLQQRPCELAGAVPALAATGAPVARTCEPAEPAVNGCQDAIPLRLLDTGRPPSVPHTCRKTAKAFATVPAAAAAASTGCAAGPLPAGAGAAAAAAAARAASSGRPGLDKGFPVTPAAAVAAPAKAGRACGGTGTAGCSGTAKRRRLLSGSAAPTVSTPALLPAATEKRQAEDPRGTAAAAGGSASSQAAWGAAACRTAPEPPAAVQPLVHSHYHAGSGSGSGSGGVNASAAAAAAGTSAWLDTMGEDAPVTPFTTPLVAASGRALLQPRLQPSLASELPRVSPGAANTVRSRLGVLLKRLLSDDEVVGPGEDCGAEEGAREGVLPPGRMAGCRVNAAAVTGLGAGGWGVGSCEGAGEGPLAQDRPVWADRTTTTNASGMRSGPAAAAAADLVRRSVGQTAAQPAVGETAGTTPGWCCSGRSAGAPREGQRETEVSVPADHGCGSPATPSTPDPTGKREEGSQGVVRVPQRQRSGGGADGDVQEVDLGDGGSLAASRAEGSACCGAHRGGGEGSGDSGERGKKQRRSRQRSWLVVFSALGGADLDD